MNPPRFVSLQVCTCGAAYVHAEAKKAPTVDGKVIRQGAQGVNLWDSCRSV